MLDRQALSNAVQRHGAVARVLIADIAGSTPRDTGTEMLVWPSGQSGTIGGGALELLATEAARKMLTTGDASALARHPLGPELGQCCGGAVTLVTEVFDASRLQAVPEAGLSVRGHGDMPISVKRIVAAFRNAGARPTKILHDTWIVEPILAVKKPLWIWGAGHVGRAVVGVLNPLPDCAVTWVDTSMDRFPDDAPDDVTLLAATSPANLVRHAPLDAQHLILTYSHALDLELCHALLSHGFATAGLIGSKTKWARFCKRLLELGHSSASIARINCPIGDPALGKHPQAIAIGVANKLLEQSLPSVKKQGNVA